ncbi:SAF domain-containing protein [Aestuariimicrobium sp. p3-SID1156]|uniref:SAF domain-containing protein n=1 Tax=Aestuariimicrobium sp. p3-SID1156 TaxID=2916038 RepID=UPI00223A787C|nr:SAF domain-containing protein [Aestuariimicrobium sp. p3-SID1156]MCT1458460.1 SAF domain-containing protein [Aestuariimicrobium sp. p3-SID1156]
MTDLSALTSRLRHALRWHRRLLAAVAAGVAILATLSVLSPAPPATATVVVAARELEPGTRLRAEDLQIRQYPVALVPRGAFSTTEPLLGRLMATGASSGMPLDRSDLVQAQRARPGRMLVPFRIQDAGVAGLLRVGDLVSVLTVDDAGVPTVLAKRVRVAALPSTDEETLIVVDVDEATGIRLGSWTSNPTLSITLG